MKKYIVSLIVIFSAIFIFSHTSFAANNDYTLSALTVDQNVVYGKYELSAEVMVTKNTDIQSGTLLMTFLSDDGLALDIRVCNIAADLPLSKGKSKTYSTDVMTFDTQVKSVKAMVWNEAKNMVPIADAVSLSNIQLTTEKYYAIVESYTNGSTSDYIDVVSLDGVSGRLYIDSDAENDAANVITQIKGSNLSASGAENFTGTSPAGRVIEYTIKKSNDKIYDISLVSTVSFTKVPYSKSNKTLYQPLADNATVLDALDYVNNGTSAAVDNYVLSSLSELRDTIKYSGFLLHPNAAGKYEHLVITWIDYLTVNDAMLTNLKSCSADIQAHIGSFRSQPNSFRLISTIKNCIDDAITYGSKTIIDSDFIRNKYGYEGGPIQTAKGYYDTIQADVNQKTFFQNALSNLNSATLTWLGTEFGVI